MIPYAQWTTLSLGPVQIYVWGLCVAVGVLVGIGVALWYARRQGLSEQKMLDAAAWTIFASLLGARVGYVATEWRYYLEHPSEIIAVWNGGMSITGALLFGLAAVVLLFRRWRLPLLAYLDAIAFALPLGLLCGRIGCVCIYDHPGKQTDFVLGQEYSDGIVRHNLGIYLAIHALLLASVLWILHRYLKPAQSGVVLIWFLLGYNIPRFFLDFLRATDLPGSDPRWFGLTFAQYTAIFFVVWALWLWYTRVYGKENRKTRNQ